MVYTCGVTLQPPDLPPGDKNEIAQLPVQRDCSSDGLPMISRLAGLAAGLTSACHVDTRLFRGSTHG